MKKYLISYDLNKADKNYDGLIDAIKSYNYIKVLRSAWAIKTNSSAESIYNSLKPYIDDNDYLYIVEINTYNEQGWLRKDIWDWLQN